MQIHVEATSLFTRAPQAANEEFAASERAAEPGGGWDAYEVWRTRIKAVQDLFRNSREDRPLRSAAPQAAP